MPGPAFSDALRPAGGLVRLARSVAVALVCTLTASVGHASAGGEIPTASLLLVLGGAAAIAWLLSARRVTPGQMVGLLILCQTCVHLGSATSNMTMSISMVAGHAAATAISALALAHGEAFVWRLAERLGLRVVLHTFGAVPAPYGRPLSPVVEPRSLHDIRLAHSRAERGPPNGC
ncbi:hypothetical protein [Aeromicrobium sp.]|uniref:hypothetical protein n=1 Tax=Aeromicrobium sp. TaxID=1871063 RepID=UPI0030BA529B